MTTRDYTIIVREEVEGNGFSRAAHDMDQVADSSDKAGKHLAAASTDLEKLDKEIETSSKRLRALSTEFSRTGNQSLFGDLRKERSFLANLKRIRKDVADEVEQAARDITPNRGLRLFSLPKIDTSQAFGDMRSKLIIALIGAVVLASPAIGAALSGAVVGTVAGGGIAGGVFAAAHDPAVQAAWGEFTKTFSREAFGADAFVRPTVAALAVLKSAFQDLHIGDTLGKGAGSVRILAEGIADLAHNLMPGLNAVMDHSAEYTSVFSQGLAGTGTSISYFLTRLVESKGTLEGLNYGFQILNATIRGTGNVLRFLADWFDRAENFAVKFGNVLRGVLIGIPTSLPGLRPLFDPILHFLDRDVAFMRDIVNTGPRTGAVLAGVAAEFIRLAPAVNGVTKPFEEAKAAADKFFEGLREDQNVPLDMNSALMDIADTLDKNGPTLDVNTRTGIENNRVIGAAVDLAKRQRDEMGANALTIRDANRVLQDNIDKINAQGVAGGITAQKMADLTYALTNMPKITDLEIRLKYSEFFAGTAVGQHPGEHSGLQFGTQPDYNPTLAMAAAITATMAGGKLQKFAGGGTVGGPLGSPQLVLAHGGERVLTSAQQSPPPVVISFAGAGDPLLDAILQALRKHVRLSGGVQAAFT